MKFLSESNTELKNKSQKLSTQIEYQNNMLDSISQILVLMSFKLADMVNIALEEGNYFRSEEWCKNNADKMMVEH